MTNEKNIVKEVGERIKLIRDYYGLSQKDFASEFNVKQRVYSYYESGEREPSLAIISQICDVFNVNPCWLVTGEGNMLVKK